MTLQMVEKETGGVTVLELSGQVVLGAESNQLRKAIKELLDKGKTRLVLDVAQVRHIDSAGLGALVAAYTSARDKGARLALSRVSERVNSLLQITKLVTVFETYPSVEAAVKSFGAAS